MIGVEPTLFWLTAKRFNHLATPACWELNVDKNYLEKKKSGKCINYNYYLWAFNKYNYVHAILVIILKIYSIIKIIFYYFFLYTNNVENRLGYSNIFNCMFAYFTFSSFKIFLNF